MSTNYYFIDKKTKRENEISEKQNLLKINDFMEWLIPLAEEKDKSFMIQDIKWRIEEIVKKDTEIIHIGKRSSGWLPLFKFQKDRFSSVTELLFWYAENKDTYEIIDEYEQILSWEQLENELINWGRFSQNSKSRKEANFIYVDSRGYEWSTILFE